MELQTLQSLLGWCLVFNIGFYLFWVVVMVGAREWLVRRHANWFAVDPERIRTVHYQLLAIYKLLIIMFNFVPWLAVVIVNST